MQVQTVSTSGTAQIVVHKTEQSWSAARLTKRHNEKLHRSVLPGEAQMAVPSRLQKVFKFSEQTGLSEVILN